ncbi:anti-sigma factor RsiW [Melghirimyces profundicolus]|uniref:Anti-sigma-W factor RsiW n=1 Tax=Melghirimyces profundicolus TaxID=1242148 RepID=A0A2T6BGK0_9BACL|nr:zf-HC2 domain-containing protein [Melghirimyces profundicolus]PTX55193.1 anti-sigma factor RsiW [Melghirimyces profundicolus]
MSSCKDMDRLIQLYVDQEIDEADHRRLKEHVAECDDCRSHLQEMIALVHSLEEIRKHAERPSKPVTMANYAIKWAAVYTAIAFLVAFVPGILQHRNTQVNEMASSTAPAAATHQKMMVLATQAEKLHIPENDYVNIISPSRLTGELEGETALVYPSAMPFFLEKSAWFQEIKRFVFVRVPDDKTLATILTASGLSPDQSHLKKLSFPMSVILTKGKKTRFETFSFPENEKKISHWYDQIATTPAIQ